MTEATAIKYVGQPLRRREDFKFVTGKGRYTDDIKAPGMLHMAVLRSPHAHAVIKQIDLSAARAARGVRLALSGADLAGKIGAIVPNWIMPGTKVPDRPVVAIDRVRFVGESVALVVAETQAMAHDAIGLIDVEYETLPAVIDEEAAIRDGLEHMRARGELRPDADTGRLALFLLAAAQGGLLLNQARRDTTALQTALDVAIDHIRSQQVR